MDPVPGHADPGVSRVYYYPGRWVQLFQDLTYSIQCTISTPKGGFLAELPIVAFRQIHTKGILHILPGTHLNTWVESSNVDKVSC